MRIYTLWHEADPGDAPWIVDAVDEHTVDNNCDVPPAYAMKRQDPHVRELVLDVPEKAVRALFEARVVTAKVVDGDP